MPKLAEFNPKHIRMAKAKSKGDLRAIADLCRNFVDQVHHDDFDADELEFLKAMDRYKRDYRRPFPTWREVLAVVKSLGYERNLTRESNRS
jgi:hypothetical protein